MPVKRPDLSNPCCRTTDLYKGGCGDHFMVEMRQESETIFGFRQRIAPQQSLQPVF